MNLLTMLRVLVDRDGNQPRARSERASDPYRFGAFRYEPCRATLYRGETEIDLPPRVLDLLEYFLDRPEQVIGKDELLTAVWQDKIVGDESLTQAVCILRQALDDNPRSPTYVRTVRRRGYLWLQPPAIEKGPSATNGSVGRSSLLASVLLVTLFMALSQCRPVEGASTESAHAESAHPRKCSVERSTGSEPEQVQSAIGSESNPEKRSLGWTDSASFNLRALVPALFSARASS